MNGQDFPSSMISLIRHGQPDFWQDFSPQSWVSGRDLPTLFTQYDQSGIQTSSLPPDHVLHIAQTAAVVYSSDLRRSQESVRKLGVQEAVEEAIFREVELPRPAFTFVRMPIFLWLILLRVFWFGGYARSCESFQKAKLRAAQAAQILHTAAQQHGTVVLVGHGFLNRFVKEELLKMGWGAFGEGTNQHWGLHQVCKSSE
jgi:broad specificity phosphatase PhoE